MTLLAGPIGGRLDDYAQTYLAGNTLASSREESRQGVPGRCYAFASADGATRYSLLLLQDQGKVYGLFAQGESRFVEQYTSTLDEMFRSLTLERPESYPETRDDAFALSVRIPPSWRETRRFSGSGTLLTQYTSPALGADKGDQTVHAFLTLTVEKSGGDFEAFYAAARARQGTALQLLGHAPWRGGYADSLRSETSMSESRVRRFYRAAGEHGYCLSFEARDDVFHRVSRWFDIIAGTLKIGPELKAPEP